VIARTLLLLLAAMVLCWSVAAQRPAAKLTAAERLRLLQLNQGLLDELIDSSLKVARTTNPLSLSEEHLSVGLQLSRSLEDAVNRNEPDRASEVAGLLHDVLAKAMIPQLNEASRTIPPSSPDYPRYLTIHRKAHERLAGIADTLPTTGAGWASERVAECRTRLGAAMSQLAPLPTPVVP